MEVIKKIAEVSSPQRQKEAGFVGNLIIIAAIMLVGLVGLKLFSAYSEFQSVKSLLNAMNSEPLATMSKREIVNAFDRRAVTSYVTVISGKDLKIEKGAGGTVISVDYQVVKPIAGNLSVLADFHASNLDH